MAKLVKFRPILADAAPSDLTKIKYPVLASPKLDGIRCIMIGGIPMSRSLKPIKNKFIRDTLAGLPDGLDGELTVGPPVGDDLMKRCQSGVMSEDGEPDFTFNVFDMVHDTHGFSIRLANAAEAIYKTGNERAQILVHNLLSTAADLEIFENDCVTKGYEGCMIRSVDGPYKQGRATSKEGYLLKVKRWIDAEAIAEDFAEYMVNENPQEINELGYAERSASKENLRPGGFLGSINSRLLIGSVPGIAARSDLLEYWEKKDGCRFDCGSGLDHEMRKEVWNNREKYRNKPFTFKFQGFTPIGEKDGGKPRFGIFKSWRDPEDMDNEGIDRGSFFSYLISGSTTES